MSSEQIKDLAMKAMNIIQSHDDIPAGYLYAELMAYGATLSDYQLVEDILIYVFKIKKSGNLLSWTSETTNLIASLKKRA
jgi:hypothetical protein